ncbi:MAG TPA: NusG domain II-containing protein [Oscillospiraceae bacterium]|nr:NusG domain II-containing protein [Oscillospiraceae bacterium]HPS35390.1 NusG domain II-containing protein [Oscillospiraceae bacterium]
MKRQFFKKADIVIIVVLLAAAAGLFLLSASNDSGTGVRITKNGQIVGVYPLNQDNLIIIDEHNSVRIDDGKVRMEHADCPDGYCLKMGEISRGSIICLPNRVVVEVFSAAAPDAIAG